MNCFRKMTEISKYFESPFLDEPEPSVRSQQWRPAFSDEEEEVHILQSEKDEPSTYQDPPDIITVISQEQKVEKKLKVEEASSINISFDDGLELADLQNIDMSIAQPANQRQIHEQIADLFGEDVEELSSNKGKEGGKILSTKKYEGNQHDQEWVRRLDKTIAARAFIYRGYGINYLKEQLRSGNYDRFTLDQTKYKSISGSMARQSFRKLQSFLMRDCKRKLQNLSGYQMKLLQTLLLNCRSTLNRHACASFLQIVKITYTLQDTNITESDGASLYESIYRALQKKICLLKGTSAPSDRSSDYRQRKQALPLQGLMRYKLMESDSLTNDMEREIIKQYISEHSISKIRDNLRSRRVLSDGATVKTIRNVLRRILRSTIRRIQNILNDGAKDYKQVYKMSDEQIKWLLQATEGLDGRKQLCRIHLQEKDDRRVMESIYRELRIILQKRDSFNFNILQHTKII